MTQTLEPTLHERAWALIKSDKQRRIEVARMLRNQRNRMKDYLGAAFPEWQKQIRQFAALPHKPSTRYYARMSEVTAAKSLGRYDRTELARLYWEAAKICSMADWRKTYNALHPDSPCASPESDSFHLS